MLTSVESWKLGKKKAEISIDNLGWVHFLSVVSGCPKSCCHSQIYEL